MTDKEFKRLSRADLIEVIYALQQHEQQLQEELASVREALDSKEIRLAQAGSIAEAAVGLNQVFETAQAAADQYLAQIQRMRAETEARCADLAEQAQRRAEALIRQAELQAEEKHQQTDQEIAEKWLAFRQKTAQSAETDKNLDQE